MRENNNENGFVDRVRRTLNDSVDSLDGETLSRLTQARHRALEKAERRTKQRRRPYRLSLAGLATAMAVILLAVFLGRDPLKTQRYSAIEDVEILAASENPDFFAELEFYAWLAEEMEDAS
jgi:hypothetical protein